MHYYTWTGPDWQHKGSATQFTAADYYHTLRKAVAIEPIIERHLQVMDRHDPEHRVGLIVDEWGTWFTVEPGTNPGFLYQQNTMRDALVAALTLNPLWRTATRVVCQPCPDRERSAAVVLTEGDRMVLTPPITCSTCTRRNRRGRRGLLRHHGRGGAGLRNCTRAPPSRTGC